MEELQRTAIVTGAGQGIGRAVARQLLAEGFRVMIADIDPTAGKAALAEFGSPQALLQPTDIADESAVRTLVERTLREWGRLDALVNNAAIADPVNGPIEELDLADWNRRLGTNLTGAFLCCKHTLPALKRSCGAIINIASSRALQSEPDTEAYAAAKGGLVALTHALAVSAGPAVRVNAVSPGWIDTEEDAAALRDIDHAQHPAGRVGRPQDVADLVAYLAGPKAGFITGQNFVVDGGMTRKMIYAE